MTRLKMLGYHRYFIKKDFFAGNSHTLIAKKYNISATRIRQILIEEFGEPQYSRLMKLRSKQREKIRKELQNIRYKSDKTYRQEKINKAKKRYERIRSESNTKK